MEPLHSALVDRFRACYGREPEIIARAPGRIEFIGNHTDYNGGPVLGAAIDRAVWVGLARRTDNVRRFATGEQGNPVAVPAGDLKKITGSDAWINYCLGMLVALSHFKLRIPAGFDYLALADLPIGAGLSSSAAIEVASGLAFLKAAGEHTPREILVQAGQYAENTFVGVPTGILDQAVSTFGRKDHLVFVDCRGPRFDTIPLPGGCHFWIFNTHTTHALAEGLYAERHRECMEAARILGVPLLVDATAAQLAAAETRLSRTAYKRARHVIDEIARVSRAVDFLQSGNLVAVGKLLLESHYSSRTWFENSTPELDCLVDTLTGMPGVHGARLTGGGFGGAAMALTGEGFGPPEAAQAAEIYRDRFGSKPDILHVQTGPGASLHFSCIGTPNPLG